MLEGEGAWLQGGAWWHRDPRDICMDRENTAHKQNPRSPLPTEVGLKEAILLTCWEGESHILRFFWRPGHSARLGPPPLPKDLL